MEGLLARPVLDKKNAQLMFLNKIMAGQPSYLTLFAPLDARNTACTAAGNPLAITTNSPGTQMFFLFSSSLILSITTV